MRSPSTVLRASGDPDQDEGRRPGVWVRCAAAVGFGRPLRKGGVRRKLDPHVRGSCGWEPEGAGLLQGAPDDRAPRLSPHQKLGGSCAAYVGSSTRTRASAAPLEGCMRLIVEIAAALAIHRVIDFALKSVPDAEPGCACRAAVRHSRTALGGGGRPRGGGQGDPRRDRREGHATSSGRMCSTPTSSPRSPTSTR